MQDPIRFVVYDRNNDNEPKQREASVEKFFSFFSEHVETDCAPCRGAKCSKKDGPAWAPSWIPEGKRRANANVESFDVLAFDIDHATEEEFNGFRERIRGLNHLIYSTHQHKPPNYRARVVFTLSRRVLVSEYRQVWNGVVAAYKLPADTKAKDEARLFFNPRCPRGTPRINEQFAGLPLDVDALKVSGVNAAQEARIASANTPRPVVDLGAVDVDEVRRVLRRYTNSSAPEENRALVRKVLAGESYAEIGERDDASHRLGCVLGRIIPIGTPTEAVLELVRASAAALPVLPDDDGTKDGFDVWMKKVGDGFEEFSKVKLNDEAGRNNIIALAMLRRWKLLNGGGSSGGSSPANGGAVGSGNGDAGDGGASAAPAEDDNWKAKYVIHPKTGLPMDVSANVSLVLDEHPLWKGVLRFDDLNRVVVCEGGPLSEKERESESLPMSVQNWLQRSKERLVVNLEVTKAVIVHTARQHTFNPVQDYLRPLAEQWDGQTRLDSFLETYCHARLTDDEGLDLSEYVRKVSAFWFIGAVARALKPGCQMDNVLVLEGEEGLRKSSLFRVLGMDGKFSQTAHIRLDDKDSKMLAGCSWIIELAELTAIRKVEGAAQKAFFSDIEDKFRAPYGSTIEKFPRRCVFVGTTNESQYLMSVTGNRRYWPIYCSRTIDTDAVAKIRDQLWAEAVVRFQAGERFHLTPEEDVQFRSVTDSRLTGEGADMEAMAEAVLDWWTRLEPAQRPAGFSMLDVVLEALKYQPHQVGGKTVAVGRVLSRMGFERCRRRIGGVLSWMYVPSEELRSMPKADKRHRHLSLIASATVPAQSEGAVQ